MNADQAGTTGYNASVLALRRYNPADLPRLMEIDHACFVEGIAYPEEEMRYFLQRRSAITLVATNADKIQGFVIADRFRSRRAAHCMGRIITIDVAPEAQKSGVGSLLLTSVEQELKRAECDFVSLEVAVDNAKAMRFYKKHGYSVLKVLPRYYLNSVDGLLMGKKL
jgi:[ribosomal protein S18]-alanine N-acetyltransferase